ncbi:MAG: antibiotic biosynthesis monooxygenase [Pseudonocardia sp.]|nr:antibiotic biosynthesis monooxygenase [Pseudonocardia sp.]
MTGSAATANSGAVDQSTGEVRVLLYHRTSDTDGLTMGYREVSRRLAGVPGQLGNELMRNVHDPDVFVVSSRWSSLAAFDAWEQGADHRESTADLRPYRDVANGMPFGVFVVVGTH